MADVKFSALPAGTAPDGTEVLAAVQAGSSVKLTAAQLAALWRTPVANNAAVGAIASDAGVSHRFEYLLTGNITLSNPTNVVAGTELIFALTQDATGGRVVTLDTNFVLRAGDAFSAAAGAVDILRCYCHSDGKLYARI